MITLKNKKVLVLGLARSGMAAINLLAKYGANITLNESKKEEQLDQLETLKPVLKTSIEAVEYYFDNDIQKAQNTYN